MNKQLKRVLAGFLAVLMVCGVFLDKLPVLAGTAAEASGLTYRLKSGTGNGNGHFGAAKPEAFVLTETDTYENEDFSYTLKLISEFRATRMRFVTKYVDDTKWAYIAYDTNADGTNHNWFMEYKDGDKTGYPGIAGLPKINKDDVVNITGIRKESGLELSVENTTTGETGTATITDENFLGVCEVSGQMGFGAAQWGSDSTEFEFGNVKYGSADYTAGWHWYKDLEGQSLTVPSYRLKSGPGNGNGHFGAAKPEAFVLTETDTYETEDFSYTLKLISELRATRMRFVTKYADDSKWAYIAYDTNADGTNHSWFMEYKDGNKTGYPSIAGLPKINKDDVVNITGTWRDDRLELNVGNITTGEEGTASIENADFLEVCATPGQMGFGAAQWGSDSTEFEFGNVKYGGTDYTAGWDWYKDFEGQSLIDLRNQEEPEEPEEPEGPEEPADIFEGPREQPEGLKEGQKWFTIEPGSKNAGGHNYGQATGPAFLYDSTQTMPKGGEMSLTFTPLSAGTPNFGFFYTYQNDQNWLYIGFDSSSGWYYQYRVNGQESYPGLAGLPTPVSGEPTEVKISLDRETLSVIVNDVTVRATNQNLITLVDNLDGKGKFGVMTKGGLQVEFSDFKLNGTDCMENAWKFLVPREGQKSWIRYSRILDVSGAVVDKEDKPMEGAVVRLGLKKTTTDADGVFSFTGISNGTHSISASKPGYKAYMEDIAVEENITGLKLTLHDKEAVDLAKYDYITSSSMKAYVGKDFPVVAGYEVGADSFRGQSEVLDTVEINGVSITPVVTPQTDFQAGDAFKNYSLALQDEASKIDMVMDVMISVDKNNLTWAVTKITKNVGCPAIATINVPKLNLISVESDQAGANFAGAKVSTTTTQLADIYIDFENKFAPTSSDSYLYAFLTSDKLSAGLWSNSEAEGDKRITLNNGADIMSLTSSPWYYERGDIAAAKSKHEFPVTSELPCAKVSIAGDINGDGGIDWNDGALAYRSIMNYPQGSENVKEMVNNRIVMNFASMAPNPFLETADNVKKVSQATDGLSQAIVLKGYGNEGHDSANSEYADIAERQGGLEDFRNLIKIAHEYNTEVGIHINAQEAYPEAASFNDKMITSDSGSIGNGWGWLDQSHVINKLWDLSTQARWKRLVQLYDRINGTDFYSNQWPEAVGESTGTVADLAALREDAAKRPDNMDLIYLDVWYQDSWETRRVAEEINALGWRFTTEFSAQGEYDSTWQHWSTDAVYGGAGAKGLNSDIIRFLRNDHRDSQVLNYPQFGGTADNPLLGGHRLYGFEGWGGDQNFNNYIKGTFNENLPTKFLQHYYVTKWVNYEDDEKGKTTSPVGNHEKEITLKNDAGDTVVVTRNEEQRKDSNIERTITLNGKVVLNDVAYLLPWTDVDTKEEKLYHWNLDGGTTTWELQDGWKNRGTVTMYELSDQGRIKKNTVNVSDGKVTLEAKAATAYILVKEEAARDLKAPYGEMNYVEDPGFNGYTGEGESLSSANWSGDIKDASISVKKAVTGDQRLVIASPKKDVEVSTTINGLTAGKQYVAQIYVENGSDAKATIEVNAGNKTVSNYTGKSILKNYVQCDEEHTGNLMESYMQIMLVSFTAESTSATLTLKREAGAGNTYMDDIRIIDKALDNYKADGSFEQDFETVAQGLYPFVLSSAQGVNDPRTHLSQKHAPYTQYGWNGRVLDDVIDGNWSLKHHEKNTGIIYQTIPQAFRFEPGKVYTVTFDYQSGANDAYAFVIGNGESYTRPEANGYLTGTAGDSQNPSTTKTHTMKVIGSKTGQTWIGLYSNASKLTSNNQLGGFDFILDNLKIVEEKDAFELEIEKTTLYLGETAEFELAGPSIDQISWEISDKDVVGVDPDSLRVEAKGAGNAIITAVYAGKEKVFNIEVIAEGHFEIPLGGATAYANTYQPNVAGEGNPNFAIDNSPSTLWHSSWSGFTVSESNPAVLTVDLGTAMAIDEIRFQQRPSANNGMIKKYQYVTGNEFNPETHTITGGTPSAGIAATAGAGAWENIKLDEAKEVRYIQIRVLEGEGNFAAIAEMAFLGNMTVATSATLSNQILEVGEEIVVKPDHGKNTLLKGIKWSSSNTDVVEVISADTDGSTAKVKAVKAGVATITINNVAGLKATATIDVTDKTELNKAISEAGKVNLALYAEDMNKAAFKKALEDAKKIATKEKATTAEITGAVNTLKTAQGKLILITDLPVDKTELNKAISEAGKVNLDLYASDANKTAFKKALEDAKKIAAKEKATIAEVTGAANTLKTAQGKLILITDISKVTIGKITARAYTGKAIKPALTIKHGSKTLKSGTDYTVSYSANKNIGTAKVTVKGKGAYKGTKTATFKITVKKNASYTVGGYKYKITNANTSGKGTVRLTGVTKKSLKSIVVKDTVKIGGKKFKITEIGSSAFKNCKQATKATIGKNVRKIGGNAFSGCKKLKTITIKGKVLKSVGKNAFKGVYSKAKIKVPSSKLKSYTKLLSKKGQGKNVKITK